MWNAKKKFNKRLKILLPTIFYYTVFNLQPFQKKYLNFFSLKKEEEILEKLEFICFCLKLFLKLKILIENYTNIFISCF